MKRPVPTTAMRDHAVGTRRLSADIFVVTSLIVGLLACAVLSIGLGSSNMSTGDVWQTLLAKLGFADELSPQTTAIVVDIRLPRVLLAACVGAALAMAGVAIQALVRNALADPYLLGISSGASTGAAASLLFGIGGVAGITICAFIGAMAAAFLVVAISWEPGRLRPVRVIFAGICVGFALAATTNFLVFTSESRDGARGVLFWMLGSFSQSRWDAILPIACVVIVGLGYFHFNSRSFDAIAIGDETALSLGTNPHRFRFGVVIAVGIVVACAVSVAGLIGFVGLVVPHLARGLVGVTHARVFVTSALLGAILLVIADAVSRSVFAPREMPVGILTALIGTPALILLARRTMRS